MFSVYHSNQLETLKILLIHLMKSAPLSHPFEPEKILVQSPGMSQWLKLGLAEEFSIAANITFPLPATFIWDLFTRVLPDVPKQSAFNKPSLIWKIYHKLPQLIGRESFLPLAQYLEGESRGYKRYQLAEKIADIYDGYLVYRPDWIKAWESGERVAELEGDKARLAQAWQSELWKTLVEYTAELGQSPYHRANMYDDFIAALNNSQLDRNLLPERLFIFGITAFPPRYLDALKAIGEHVDVHLLLSNPSQQYWGDIKDEKYLAKLARQARKVWQKQGDGVANSQETKTLHIDDATGNTLLASWGKLGRDTQYLLSQTESDEHEFFIHSDETTLLNRIQSDILALDEPKKADEKVTISLVDDSITFHRCHSAMREVEVLHDHLLALFNAKPNLKPRDIIVMVADIDKYTSAINAVFGNAPGERYIPYSISDRSMDAEHPLLQAFIKLVALPKSRCLASELLEILETPTVLRRFAIENDEFVQIQQWVKDTGIRWGLNRQTQRQFSLPEVSQHTWEFGLQRILAGYALGEDIQIFDTGEQHIAPYNEIQGSMVELAGKMALFIDSVRLHREQLSLAQDIDQWRTSLLTMLDDFFLVESEDEIVMTHIRQWIDDLADEVAVGGVSDKIDADIISHHLQSRFGQASVSQRFLAGQLNFCTLMPMRSIPFKTVCLLGMNDGTFPRHRPREAFDLMSHAKVRPGDRSRRDDDRYLFLEALLSAQDSFYISYIGASIQDNSELMPSLLVSELQEYCQDNYMLNEDGLELIAHLTYMHPMTPYHPDNFLSPHASFASEWIGLKGETFEQSLPQTPSASVETRIESEVIELSDLLRFWRLPVAYYFNRELKVFFEQETLATDDDEPFALDGLEHFKTRQFLLNEMLGQAFSEDKAHWQRYWLNVLSARGQLPVGPFGEMAYDLIFSQADSLFEASAAIRQQPLQSLEVSAVLHPWQDERTVSVTGWLDGQFAAGMLRLHCGRLSAKVLISAWLEHLFACLAGGHNSTHIFGFSKKNGLESHCFSPLQPEQAEFLLAPWLQFFVEGTNKPLAFFPETALRGVEACYQENGFDWDEEVMHAAMKKVFESTDFSQGEDANPYVQRIWSAWNEELARNVSETAKLLLSDLIEAMTKRDE